MTAFSISSVSESARAITGKTLVRSASRRMTLISAGDTVSPSSDESESSPEDVSGISSGGLEGEMVVTERVFVGSADKARLADSVKIDVGSIMYMQLKKAKSFKLSSEVLGIDGSYRWTC